MMIHKKHRKGIIVCLLTTALVCSLYACSNSGVKQSKSSASAETQKSTITDNAGLDGSVAKSDNKGKILIAYFTAA